MILWVYIGLVLIGFKLLCLEIPFHLYCWKSLFSCCLSRFKHLLSLSPWMFSLGNVRRNRSRSEFQITSSVSKELDRVNQKTTVKSQPVFVYFHSECTDYRHVHSLWKTRHRQNWRPALMQRALSTCERCVITHSVLESLFIHFQHKTLLYLCVKNPEAQKLQTAFAILSKIFLA